MIRPVIAIVGRPNVGKSTLFNRLIGRRHAIVRDVPGVTRDRLYGQITFERWQASVVDTGGFDPSSVEPLIEGVRRQVETALTEADLVLFVVDTRAGVTGLDTEIAAVLRKANRPVVLVANKVDSAAIESAVSELYRLGFGEPVPVSAEHGRGVAELLEIARDRTIEGAGTRADATPAPASASTAPAGSTSGTGAGVPPGRVPVAITIVGRPNVGKSSMVNALVGAERVLVHSVPGTTRDAIDTPFTYRGKPYVLVDTAGIRRKGKVSEALEKLSVVMALKSLERCQVAVVVLDAADGLTAQDAHIAGYAHEAGRATVIAVNKWDLVPPGMVRRAEVTEQIRDRLPFLDYAPLCFTSAASGEGLPDLFDAIDVAAAESRRRVPAHEVTEALQRALARRPISLGGVPLTLQSASQVSAGPPVFALRVNRPREIHFSYERYLAKALREAFGFAGSPIRISFRSVVGRRARATRGSR
ncbi:MAG: ribosome biogenesis GTPase Der [Candidatus Rokubacteria bacterium]|nr:ribosome biogenesis GTPase Der [Candidatus Rokubacteria bacterium]